MDVEVMRKQGERSRGCAGKECKEVEMVQGSQLPFIVQDSCVALNASDAEELPSMTC